MRYHIEHERVVRRMWELTPNEVTTAVRRYVLAMGPFTQKGMTEDDLQVEITFDEDSLVVTGAKVVWEADRTVEPLPKEGAS